MTHNERAAHFLLALVLTAPLIWFNGTVLMTLWAWFITPTYGLMPPGIWAAMGLVITIGWLRDFRGDGRPATYHIVNGFLNGLLVLLFGWVILMLGGL